MSIHQTYQFPFASYPAVRIVLLLAAGIIVDYQVDPTLSVWAFIFVCATILYLISEISYHKSLHSRVYTILILSYLGIIISFGGTWHSLWDYRDLPHEAQVINTYTWEELIFSGSIQQIQQTSTGKYQVDVDVDTTIFPDDLIWHKSFKLRAVLNPADHDIPTDLNLGNNITFEATVYPLEDKRNPSQFNYKQYLASQDIYTQVGIQQIISITPVNNIWRWSYFRKQVLNAIDTNFSKESASLAKALLIGYKNELAREEKISFSRAGLSHIMAVSGLHVGFLLFPFWLVIPFFWTLKYGKQIGITLLIIMLFIYAGLTNFSPSVTRASLVGILLAYGKLFHKVRDSKNLTAVAALIILLINPSDLFSIGFQLSFGAVYIILLTAPVIQRWLPAWIRFRWYGKPIMIIIISFIVQIGLFPLLAYYFGEFSLVGPLANAFVIPFLGIAVPLGLALLLIAPFASDLAQTLNYPVDIFLKWLHYFVDFAASLPWSWIQVHVDSLLFFGIWIAIIFLIASLPIPKLRWKFLALLLLVSCLHQGNRVIQKLSPATLNLTFFDVGQGDAALVTTPNNKHFLIDAGRWQPDYNSAKYIIIPHLKEQGIEKLDAIFLSHPHADHIGGILEIIDSIPVDTIYNSGTDYDSQLFKTYNKKAVENNIPIKPLKAGDKIYIDPAIPIFVYGPQESVAQSNVNNRSLVIELIYGDTEFLFMGDAEHRQEENLLKHYPEMIDTDFLKVGHHGSKTSSSSLLLQSTTPQAGVVSLAKRNRFGHPHRQATRLLHKYIPNLYFTSLEGAVQFYSDGENIYKQ
ncbi:DNA internalization-related competence protein ComEC/Rec2 [Fodinibius sp.]|uniref:DNA internalization-related competence protein ComEC/Rec2 n=1 Tax=Fodinibius sp. TaxID=1872440 RepID=UPI002ACEE002|nr:DNA internalization-related competence protein ComEC/Rec2 [Fodinibius sp.]MDZ7659891.1 DNA internalization-related competence protein ComEC/Rec2 [Fodinibius sp.]